MIMLRRWKETTFITRATYVARQCAADVCDLHGTLSITLTPTGLWEREGGILDQRFSLCGLTPPSRRKHAE